MSARYIPPEDFDEVAGKEHLALYQWGDHDVNHWFCKTIAASTRSTTDPRSRVHYNV